MARIIEVNEPVGLAEYEAQAHLAATVANLRQTTQCLSKLVEGRTLWMVNSTASGGGVAEMMPKQVALLRELGLETQWAVIDTDRSEFFDLTKRIHNMLHGVGGERSLTASDHELLEEVGRDNAAQLAHRVGPRDVVLVHDPQPLAAGRWLVADSGATLLWRCHVGLAERTEVTREVWRFLRPHLANYDHAVFTTPEYVPGFLAEKSTVIPPSIDPLSDKNRELAPHRLSGVLCNAGLAVAHTPVLTERFEHVACRLEPDGSWVAADLRGDLGLATRPIVTQISRWDRLKGFGPLMEAFCRLKKHSRRAAGDPVHARRVQLARLVLAGPDPQSVADDPEGRQVLAELVEQYRRLDPALQADVIMLALPMQSRRENALMVNALQRCSTVVVQNSVREGFGLTATEAMWKGVPLVASNAHGLRQQVRDGIEGRVVTDPHSVDEVAEALDETLADRAARDSFGRCAQKRVQERFLVLSEIATWLRTLQDTLADVDESSRSARV